MLKFATVVLFLSTLALAKQHKPSDYPLNITVNGASSYGYGLAYGNLAKTCAMTISSGANIWYVNSKDFHCRQFTPGTHLYGRLRDLLGQHFIYLAWQESDKHGKIQMKEAYYVIESAAYGGH